MNRIETIARGICVKGGRVLLCRGRKAGNLYFPGGHIEFGEKGATALEREVLEETGLASKAVAFLGVCEHRFVQNGSEDHAEINLVYALDIPDADPARPVEAKEGWIAFDWIDAAELADSAVEPAALRRVALQWLADSGAAANRIV
ncbi:MAG: NUDIX domain-containing protein [Kiritimatiellae bacterium]|nr:NUDIX domain-containing protein [Kiritimatiellia bacterium]